MESRSGVLWFCLLIFSLVIATTVSSVIAEELTPELCKAKAIAAAKLIEQEGEVAYEKLRDPEGAFRFGDGKGYVWVQTTDNMMLMHPIKPSMDGKDLSEYQDVKGMYLFTAFCEICEEHGAGWVPYSWTKPGEETESPKVSYVIQVSHGGKEYITGAGVYDVTAEDIKSKFPGDPIYED